jgi:two-component system response regulator (stage 0 sporulation protein F)
MDNIGTLSAEKTVVKSVLVVDDEENFVDLLDWFLSNRGYEVRTALNGEEALELVEKAASDLALIDIRMGSMDGLSLLGEMKQRQPEMKVIMMTAYPTTDTRRQAFGKGASAFFTKPVDLQELLSAIDDL